MFRKTTSWYSQKFNFRGIPAAVVIDADGKVQWHGHPMDGGMDRAVRAAVATVKKGANAPSDHGAEHKAASDHNPLYSRNDFTKEELQSLKVHDLKQILSQHNVVATGLLEKGDYVEEILQKVVRK